MWNENISDVFVNNNGGCPEHRTGSSPNPVENPGSEHEEGKGETVKNRKMERSLTEWDWKDSSTGKVCL